MKYLSLFLLLSGCASIVSVSQSDMKVYQGHAIDAEDHGYGFMELSIPELSTNKSLAKQCPAGTVTGVETVLTRYDFFFVQRFDLNSTASCQDDKVTK
jgi:hypothetical protein